MLLVLRTAVRLGYLQETMAQALFEALTGGVSTMDNQTAMAVQSLLESQNVPETVQPVDDEDVFQCGKCKKQFNSIGAFVTHKQGRCTPQRQVLQVSNPVCTTSASAFSTSVPHCINRPQIGQPVPAYGVVPQSPLTQLTHGMVLTDDLMAFANMDQAVQAPTIQMGTTVQATGPFLSQLPPFTTRSSNNVTILSPVTSHLTSNGSAFTSTVSANQIQFPHPTQITLTALSEVKPPTIAKPSPTKAGRKSAQANLITVITDVDPSTAKHRRTKNSTIAGDFEASIRRKLRCQYCDKGFAKNFDLQQHIRAHTGEKPFQCIVCGRAFAQKSNVKKHMTTHKVWPTGSGTTLPKQPSPVPAEPGEDEGEGESYPDQAPAEPEACPTPNGVPQPPDQAGQAEQENDMQRLDDSQDDDTPKVRVVVDNSYLCQYCNMKFRNYFNLKTHMVQHKVEQVYKCVMKKCGSTFHDLDAFLEHTKTHEEEMQYRCHMCNKFFPSLYELGVHQYSHSLYPNQGPKPGPRHWQCTKCMNKYSTPEALEHHLATTNHSYPCPHCNKTFPCERYLRRHLPTHGSEGQFQCPTCSKRFKTENYLKMHSLIHTGEKPFVCELCNAAFNRKDKLKRHMLIHDSTKRYRCPFKSLTGCSKEFNRPDKLKAHIITHSGIKPFKCKECGKGFSRRPHLVEHERGHRADYKFKCEKCGKGFFRPKLFQEHRCQPTKDGNATQVFRPRNRRKIGRPRKRMISITVDMLKRAYENRGRPRRGQARNAAVESASPAPHMLMPTVAMENTAPVHETGITEVQITHPEEMNPNPVILEGSRRQPTRHEFCVKAVNPETGVDHYVTVQLTETADGSGSTIQTNFIPAISTSQVLSPSGTASLQPMTIIEAQPVSISVADGHDHIVPVHVTPVSLADIPVQLAISNSGTVPMGQVVATSTGVSSEESFVSCAGQLEDFHAGVGDPVLQGTESLLQASAEILQSADQ